MFQSSLLSILSFLSQQAQLVFIMTGWTSADVGTVASRWSKSEQRGYVPSTVPHATLCTSLGIPWTLGIPTNKTKLSRLRSPHVSVFVFRLSEG